jgi:hypothetical protein
MKKCANCDCENPDEASICQKCQSRSFLNPRRNAVEEASKRIKLGWVAGVISASITFIVSLLPLFGVSILGFDSPGIPLNILGSLFVGALAFGVYRKSRACASVLLGQFLFWKIVLIVKYGVILGIWAGLVYLYCFIQGVRGTFEWHSLEKGQLKVGRDSVEP